MSQRDESPRGFRLTTVQITAIAGLIASVAALFNAFGDLGLVDTAGDGGQPARQEPAMNPSSGDTGAPAGPGPGDATITADRIAGAWIGTTARRNASFRVTLTVAGGCTITKPCGTISIVKCDGDITQRCTFSAKAPRCAGDVALQGVVGTTVELYVSFRRCLGRMQGQRGHFLRPLGEDALRYETDFGLEGTLRRRSA